MTQRTTGQRFRQRKLSTRQNLNVVREDEVEAAPDDDAQRHIAKVETGVEKGEEIEHHLQAAISASAAAAVTGKVAQVYIPTPETTIATSLQYDRLYPPRFSQPATYIRFSSTVEDCVGITYCLTAEDDAFLTSLNQQRSGHHETLPPCTEAQIEEVMDVFEQATQTAQPFAAVDCPSVLSYEELAASIDHSVEVGARPYATQIYEHWKSQRTQRGNRALMPGLKYETGQETDDSDPFVCFRRREVRQTRKTRGRDAQVVEKLRKLRRELEQARQLVHLVCQRETLRRDQLAIDRHIFEKRVAVKELKRTLGIKGDDDGLLTQKTSPRLKVAVEPAQIQRGMPGSRPSQGLGRSDARAPDTDMVMIQDMLVRKDNEIRRFIDDHIARHQAWNRDWVDLTWRAITPPLEDRAVHGFRTAITEPFPTPPESVTSEVVHESVDTDEFPAGAVKTSPFGPSNQPQTPPPKSSLSFRRRIGRGGRLMVDRRGLTSFHEDVDNEWKSDRWKYDNDSEDVPGDLYKRDFYDNMSTRYRMFLRTPQSRESSIVRDAAISSAIQSARTASDSSARPM